MAKKIFEHVLPAGTVLTSQDKTGELHYTIEAVYQGGPVPADLRTIPEDSLTPALGQGGFGITYLASRQIVHGNIVLGKGYYAIKEFFLKGQCYRRPGSTQVEETTAEANMKETMRDFRAEALRLKEICQGNRNIVNVNEVFEANGTAYYVMEYISGMSLRTLVQKEGPMSEGKALSIIRPVAEALHFIHTRYRLLHLDIKPDNIMMKPNSMGGYDPIIIDFGISVHFDKKGNVTTTHHATGVSAPFSPAEQYGGIDKIIEGRRILQQMGLSNMPLLPCEVDVYALGATLFYMLVGQEPLDAFSLTTEYINQKLPADISDNTRQAVINALQKEPKNRTKTAADFLKAFEQRYTLPIGYKLRGQRATYVVTDIVQELPCAIHYGAMLYTGEESSQRGNTTLVQRYDVYEYFVRGSHQRNKQEAVEGTADYNSQHEFDKLCQRVTRLTDGETYHEDNNMLYSEVVSTNGTQYAIAMQGKRPPKPNPLAGVAEKASGFGRRFGKPLLIGLAAVLALMIVIGIAASGSTDSDGEIAEPIEEVAVPTEGTAYYNSTTQRWDSEMPTAQAHSYEYEGALNADGQPEGEGTCTAKAESNWTLIGSWKDGKPQSGELTFDNGSGFITGGDGFQGRAIDNIDWNSASFKWKEDVDATSAAE